MVFAPALHKSPILRLNVSNAISSDQNGKFYLPVHHNQTNGQSQPETDRHDSMHLDDTKDRVYIHDLDAELSDIDSAEEKLVFLPDIEKKLGKIPKSLLVGDSHPSAGNEMVLYGVPTSLTIPEEQDKVRKAIMESRERAREKQIHEAEMLHEDEEGSDNGKPNGVRNHGHVHEHYVIAAGMDGDPMDIE